MALGTLSIDGVQYDIMVPFESFHDISGTTFTSPEMMRVVNKCTTCNRFNLEPIELHTIEELLEYGWLRLQEEVKSEL